VTSHRPATSRPPYEGPLPARQAVHSSPGLPRLSAPHAPSPQPENMNGTGQALHPASTRPQGTTPGHGDVLHDKEPDSRPRSPQSCAPHKPHMPHQHRAEILMFPHFCWPEARFVCFHDRNRPYNLPVCGRQVTATNPASAPQPGRAPQSSPLRKRLTAPTRHFTPLAALAAGASLPSQATPSRQVMCRRSEIPTKSPQLTGPISHTRIADFRAFLLIRSRTRKLPR
jgi:hypothetical protein